MFLSMNWIQDFVDLSGLDKIELAHSWNLLFLSWKAEYT